MESSTGLLSTLPSGALVILDSAPFYEFNTLWKIRQVQRLPDGTWEVADWHSTYVVSTVVPMPLDSSIVVLSFGLRDDDWVDLYTFNGFHRNVQEEIRERKPRTRRR